MGSGDHSCRPPLSSDRVVYSFDAWIAPLDRKLREMTRVGDQKVLVGGKPRSAESATMATSLRGHVQYDADDARFQYRQHRRVRSRFAFAERAVHGHIETALVPRGH